MSKTVFVVFDTDLEKVVGVYTNQEAAEDCENSSPGDRYIEEMTLDKRYNEDMDPRSMPVDPEFDGEINRESYEDDELYDRDEDEEDEEEREME